MLSAAEAAHIDRILAEPRNPAARLDYADWLKAHGSDQREEYLRLQCQQAHFLNPNHDFWESGGTVFHRRQESQRADTDQKAPTERMGHLEKELDADWLVWVLEDFAIPPGLSEQGVRAARTILKLLASQKMSRTGGVHLFRSPHWGRERGLLSESSCAVLIVVYDVWLQPFFEYVPHRPECTGHEAAMDNALGREGFFAEPDGMGRARIIAKDRFDNPPTVAK